MPPQHNNLSPLRPTATTTNDTNDERPGPTATPNNIRISSKTKLHAAFQVMADVAAVVAAAAGSRGIGIGGNLVSLGCGVAWCGVAGLGGGDPVVSRVHVLGGRWGGTGEEWFENSTFSSWSLPPPPPPPIPNPALYDADHLSPFRPSFSSPCLVLVPVSSSVDAPPPPRPY